MNCSKDYIYKIQKTNNNNSKYYNYKKNSMNSKK